MMEKSKKVVVLLQLVELLVIVFAWAVQGSDGPVLKAPLASPPLTSAAIPPLTEGTKPSVPVLSPMASPPLTSATPPPAIERPLPSSPLHFPVASPPLNTPSPPLTSATPPPAIESPLPSSPLQFPLASPPHNTPSPPLTSATPPPAIESPLPSSPLHFPLASPPHNTPSPPSTVPVQVPSLPPTTPEIKAPPDKTHVPVPVALAPVAPSSMDGTQNAPATLPSIPGTLPPVAHQSTEHRKAPSPVASPPKDIGPIPEAAQPNRTRTTPSISPVQGVPPTRGFPENSPAISPVVPRESPPPVKGVPPTSGFLGNSPAISPVVPGDSQPTIPDRDVSPASTPPTSTEPIPPVSRSPTKGSFSAVPPSMDNATRHSPVAPSPSNASPKSSSIGGHHSPASSPSASDHKDSGPAPTSDLASPPAKHQDQVSPPTIAPKGSQGSNAPPPIPSAVPPTGRSIHNVPPPYPPAVPPTGRATHYAPPPYPPAVPPTGTATHYASPPFPSGVPPTNRPSHYVPPPFPSAVPPTSRASHNIPPPFASEVPPTSSASHYASPPFLSGVPPTDRPTDYAPPPFSSGVPPTSRPTHHAPPPFPSGVPPTGRPTHYAPPPFPPAIPPSSNATHHAPLPVPPTVPPTGRSTHYAPTPLPLAVPPTGLPSHYAPPPFLPTVSPKGMPRHYASPPFLPAVSPKGRPIRNASPPFPPTVSPTAGPTHYTPAPFLPAVPPRGRPGQYAPPPLHPGSSNTRSRFPFPPMSQVSPAPSPTPKSASDSSTTTFNPHLPQLSPSGSPSKSPKVSPPPPIMTLPPPPPNEDCSGTICTEPLTNTPPGSPCACVWPMQVGLSLGVDLFTFFPLVSELASEIAAGVFMKQSQVRIMGANAASQQPEKTVVLIDLVPMGEKFDNTTAFLTFQRFWLRKVDIKKSYFGDYEVLYVRYQGLPPSPPLPPSSIGMIDDGPYSGNGNNGRTIKPLGVDVQMKRHKNVLSGSIIAIIVLSAFVVIFLCSVAAWFLLVRHRSRASQQPPTPQASLPSLAKPSGAAGSMVGSVPSSASLSFGSSIVTYTGSAKTYSITDIERATNNFDESRVLGEGGFGRVYSADLDDGTKAAVKVLKRDDQQGGREFLAEVEMLSRLHHRNLVKLIGICTDERARCLVYELVPNGSVESHLHGVDKESAPLDWASRMKIALGAARGLAYLHEDSSPRVIHRDFKSSNILLEHDFTPKVSDFGLARTALDEESRHISTRVMGTFGYVAPEYAMTGHLLVKSDVYSYGVVLLELLTGRKPVDMSQPPGQENLVSYARPLLTSQEGLQILTDSSLGPDVPHDSVAKVAAIASMCVQPEVSHRPFMGEVVQALKLICNECDEANKEMGSRTSSHENLSVHCSRTSTPGYGPEAIYDSGYDPERGMSVFGGGSLRESRSGPLTTGRGWRFWRRMEGGVGGGSGGPMFRSRSGSY